MDDLFTVQFWQLALERAVRAGAAAALGVIGSAAAGTIGAVPWYGVASAAGIGALVSLLLSLASQTIPDTLPTSFIHTPPKGNPQ